MSTTSPNMSLVIPSVGTESGPTWAADINASLTLVDQHNHSSGQGVQIQPNGLNINSDLAFQSNNATDLRSTRYTPQAAALAVASDIGCLYVVGNELYYNDVTGGNNVQITTNGSVNSGAGSITGLPSGTASASYSAGTFVWQSATSRAANMDAASYLLRNSTANSKALTLQPPSAMAANYSLTLPATPASQSFLALDTSGNITGYAAVSGGITGGMVASSTLTLANLASSLIAYLVPSGSMLAFGGSAAPSGFLLCNGSAVSRVTYSALFTAIGTAYGSGDGSTTFNVPDLRGLFIRGTDNGAGRDPDAASRVALLAGGATGDAVGSYEADALASHRHTVSISAVAAGGAAGSGLVQTGGSTNTSLTGGNETRPKNVYANYIIKT